MMKKEWRVKSPDIEKSSALAVRLEVSPLLAQLLVNRGIETVEAAQAYLYPTLANLHDPFLMHDMEKAVERIHAARENGEKIWVYGDYDTDGTTAVALLLSIFRELDTPVRYYIPNRFREGYGLNQDAVKDLKAAGCDLVITVDCGITSVNEVQLAIDAGMDVIITDHHQAPPDELPPAHAVITPKMANTEYHLDGLAGVGLAFKLAHGLMGGGEPTQPLIDQLDLVVLGTVVDMATLTGENRTLTRLGLEEVNHRKRPGIHALCEVANFNENKPIIGHTLGFVLGPRINAAGRMDTASKVVELLTSQSYEAALPIAEELDDNNRERREVEGRINEEAVESINKSVNLNEAKGLVLAREGWHQGVVGIVASRISQRYHRPVFLLAINGPEATGSGRSVGGLNLADSLNAATHLLVKHGGHRAAAGLTIETEKIEKFRECFNEYASEHLSEEDLVPKLDIDFEAQASFLTINSIRELSLLEPYGLDNPAPQLAIRGLVLQRPPLRMGKEKQHLKLFVTDGRHAMDAVGWGMADYEIALRGKNVSVDLAGEPQINDWDGRSSPQLSMKDIRKIERHDRPTVFPSEDTDSPVKLVDRRHTDKKAYVSKLLEQEEPTIFYVRDEKAINQLFEIIGPQTVLIGRCDDTTSESEFGDLTDALESGRLLAIVSSRTMSEASRSAKHLVFCHPVFTPLTFYNQCQPPFRTPETTYIHLIYSAKDVNSMHALLSWQYPDEKTLKILYR
ncbi:MAG: single-stranded-DNA-specific exonuclease RecJ, partial [Candidatus Poribacteria bacterium]|nr:single-stranded-DNA-specific exonuclease RecJ [Candidatus Poribacteria bacterium]